MKTSGRQGSAYRTARLRMSILVLLFCLGRTTFAQGNFWMQTNGPFGGAVWALATDPKGALYCGARGGSIFKYSTKDRAWSPLFVGATRQDVAALVIDGEGQLFFAATNDGVFKGDPKTNSWKKLEFGLGKSDVAGLSLTAKGTLLAGASSGLFRFDPDGEKWVRVPGITESILALRIYDHRIFAVGNGEWIHHSPDDGHSWTRFAAPERNSVSSISIDKEQKLYSGTRKGEVFQRESDGSWKQVAAFPGNSVRTLETDASDNIYVALGGPAFSSEGGGLYLIGPDRSKPKLILDDNSNGLAALLVQKDELIAGTNEGVWRSLDRGESWHRFNAGLIAQRINDIVIDRNDVVFAGSYGGVFRSSDNGRTWTEMNRGLTKDIGILDMALNKDGHLFVGTYLSGIYRSTDGGTSWQKKSTGIPRTGGNWIMNLAVNSKNHIFAGVLEAGLYRSLDNGDSWQRVGLGVVTDQCCALVVDSKDVAYAANSKGDLYRSDDDGATWRKLPVRNSPNDSPTELVVDAYDRLYYGASEKGVFRYSEKDQVWQILNRGLRNTTIRSLLFAKGLLFAGSSGANDYQNFDGNDLFLSTDFGTNWSWTDSGLRHPRVKALAVNSLGTVFAGTWGGGVYRSIRPIVPAS